MFFVCNHSQNNRARDCWNTGRQGECETLLRTTWKNCYLSRQQCVDKIMYLITRLFLSFLQLVIRSFDIENLNIYTRETDQFLVDLQNQICRTKNSKTSSTNSFHHNTNCCFESFKFHRRTSWYLKRSRDLWPLSSCCNYWRFSIRSALKINHISSIFPGKIRRQVCGGVKSCTVMKVQSRRRQIARPTLPQTCRKMLLLSHTVWESPSSFDTRSSPRRLQVTTMQTREKWQ